MLLLQRGRRRGGEGGGGGVDPPLLKAGGLSPSSFSHLFVLCLLYGCMVTITNLHLVYIIVFVNTHALVTPEKSGENLWLKLCFLG